jgi:hypothetical protein
LQIIYPSTQNILFDYFQNWFEAKRDSCQSSKEKTLLRKNGFFKDRKDGEWGALESWCS